MICPLEHQSAPSQLGPEEQTKEEMTQPCSKSKARVTS